MRKQVCLGIKRRDFSGEKEEMFCFEANDVHWWRIVVDKVGNILSGN